MDTIFNNDGGGYSFVVNTCILQCKDGSRGKNFWIQIQKTLSLLIFFHNITATAEPDRKEYDLTKEQIEYIIKEFRSTKFEITKENAGGGVSGVVFKLKDGSEKSFSVVVNQITVNGKQYKCHSYLTAFILSYGFDK